MTPEVWKKVEEIYHAALECAPERRTAFLNEVCSGDAAILRQVESLLAEKAHSSIFMERPAMEVAAESMAAQQAARAEARTGKLDAVLPSLGARYVVLDELGRGGMGIVYRVRDNETDEIVAVKVLNPDVASDRQMVERFRTELKLARRVTHRSVCRIYDIHYAKPFTYISMEFVGGESLRRVLQRFGALGIAKGIELIRQICEGLREAHAQGIIHRDLKPENIMLDETGNVKIMDFGIARLASNRKFLTNGVAGTPSYMSPEQAGGHNVDERSDIYSLGLLMYEIFTGRIAFAGDTPVAVALKQIRENPPSPRTLEPMLPAQLEQVILRCMEKDPSRRYPSLSEVLSALPVSDPSVPRPSGAQNTPKISTWFPETAFVMEPRRARLLLMLIQAGYLCLYFGALYNWDHASEILVSKLGLPSDLAALRLLIFSAMAGIAARIFLISALVFDHPDTGKQYWRLFPALLLLDAMWSASPLLVAFAKFSTFNMAGFGAALACAAVLAYLPFSQKTLMSNAYR